MNSRLWQLLIGGAILVIVGLFLGIIWTRSVNASEIKDDNEYQELVFTPVVTLNGDCNGWTVDATGSDVKDGRSVWKVTSVAGVDRGTWSDVVKSHDYSVTVTWTKFYKNTKSEKFHDELRTGNITKPGNCKDPVVPTTPTVTPTPAVVAPVVSELPATGSNDWVMVLGALGLVGLGIGLDRLAVAKRK